MMSPSAPIDTFRTVQHWLEQGRRAWLATVLATRGTGVRPAGTVLAVNDRGEWANQEDADCLEQVLLDAHIKAHPEPGGIHILEHQLTIAEQSRYGWPDNGYLRLLIEPVTLENDLSHLDELVQALSRRRPVTRRVTVETSTREVLSQSVPNELQEQSGVVLHTLAPECRLLLGGATPVTAALIPMARRVGFDPCVYEPRSAFAKRWDDSLGSILTELDDEKIPDYWSDRYCAILALGQSQDVDDPLLYAAMDTEAFYIGALGALQAHARRKERLYQMGVPAHWLGTVRAPIGFEIGARSPAEMAVAILADLVAERYRRLRRNSRL